MKVLVMSRFNSSKGNDKELTKKVDDLAALSADTAKKSEVRLKTTKLSQTDMSEEFLQQIAGNTPINAVPANESVTLEKLEPQLQSIFISEGQKWEGN